MERSDQEMAWAKTLFRSAHQIRLEYKRTDYESMWPIWRMDLHDIAQVLFRPSEE